MDARPLSETYAVSPQIEPEDVKVLAEAGYKSVMCNRPDGEEFGQPDFALIAAAAEAQGMQAKWIPIVGGPTQEAMAEFTAALDEMPGPMLAYCRSGTRCAMLWTIAQFGKLDEAQIVSATSSAGYDMAGVVQQLQQMRG